MSIQEYRAVRNAIAEAEVIRLFLKKRKERDALTLLIGLGNDKLQAIVDADRKNGKTKIAAMYGKCCYIDTDSAKEATDGTVNT